MPPSPYLAALRRTIGNDLLVLPSVAAFIHNDAERLLLARDAATGRWITVGGMIEPEEDPREALVRECAEETSLIVQPGKLVSAFGGPEYRITYPNGDQVSWVVLAYETIIVSGTPTPDLDEISELGWYSKEELAALEMSTLSRNLTQAAFAHRAV